MRGDYKENDDVILMTENDQQILMQAIRHMESVFNFIDKNFEFPTMTNRNYEIE